MEVCLPKRLLVVEDALDIQLLLRRLFESEGYEVDCASNGQEAIEILQHGSRLPDLIVLDLMMPVMDGYEFRERQRGVPDWSRIPVLIMTADGDVPSNQTRVDADGFLKKPVDIDELLSTVSRHCNQTEARASGS